MLEIGTQIHDQLQQTNYHSSTSVQNSLLTMYAKCGALDKAQAIFHDMRSRGVADVYTWTSMISAFVQSNQAHQAIQLFNTMSLEKKIAPNNFTYAAVLTACANANNLNLGKEIHSKLRKQSNKMEVVLETALLNMYAKCNAIEEAQQIFDSMRTRKVANMFSWTAIISGYSHEQPNTAIDLFLAMQEQYTEVDTITYTSVLAACAQTANIILGEKIYRELVNKQLALHVEIENSLINMFAKCKRLTQACELFESMVAGSRANVVTWNAMINGYALNGKGREAIDLFQRMQKEKITPDAATFVCLLMGCSHAGLVKEAFTILNSMENQFHTIPELQHNNCMVDVLSRNGKLEEAESFVQKMPTTTIVTWTALLSACRATKNWQKAQIFANKALSFEPSNASVHVLLANTYAMAGKWDLCKQVREQMDQRGIKKIPGITWTNIGGKPLTFYSQDQRYPGLYDYLTQLNNQLLDAGYDPDTNWVLHDVGEEQKEARLCAHRFVLLCELISKAKNLQ